MTPAEILDSVLHGVADGSDLVAALAERGYEIRSAAESPYPPGPSLIYVTEGDNPTVTVLDRADLTEMPFRDRALCRALLNFALALLGAFDEPGPMHPLDGEG